MSQEPEKKIIVDEDWKTQVERERAAEEAGEPVAGGDKPSPDVALPPADLTYLIMTLSLEAFACLGLMPGKNEKAEKNLPLAKNCIDLLEVLQQKTEGNRTDDETRAFDDTLYQLRMAFVQIAG